MSHESPYIQIVVSGVPGAGKTTCAIGIAHILKAYGFDVVVEDVDGSPAPPTEQSERVRAMRGTRVVVSTAQVSGIAINRRGT